MAREPVRVCGGSNLFEVSEQSELELDGFGCFV
jgi:hypothetical protein